MALDMKKLKDVQKDLDSKNGGDGLFVRAGSLGEETDFRIAPPKPNAAGMYFQESTVFWINKKIKLVSNASFGKPCVIQEEIDAARALADADLDLLLDDAEQLSKKTEYHIPGFFLKCEFDAKGNPVTVKVVDEKCKVLECGPQLMKAINRVVTSRNVQNGTEDGITDMTQGYNILILKTGKMKQTEYNAQAWREPFAMDEKYYADAKIPDVVKLAKDSIESDEYQIGVIRNYLYGEAMPEKTEKAKPAAEAVKPAAKVAAPARRAAAVEEPVVATRRAAPAAETKAATPARRTAAAAETEPVVARRGAAAAPATAGRRSLVDDVDNLDD